MSPATLRLTLRVPPSCDLIGATKPLFLSSWSVFVLEYYIRICWLQLMRIWRPLWVVGPAVRNGGQQKPGVSWNNTETVSSAHSKFFVCPNHDFVTFCCPAIGQEEPLSLVSSTVRQVRRILERSSTPAPNVQVFKLSAYRHSDHSEPLIVQLESILRCGARGYLTGRPL